LESVDRSSPIPLYYQIKLNLKRFIEDNKLKPNDPLPPEEELAKYYKVSRLTVRQAMQELVKEGLIYRIQGKGTYVAENKMISDLSHLTGFSEEMEKIRKKAWSKVLTNKLVKPPEKVADAFHISGEAKVLLLSRLRYEGDRPRSIENAYLNISKYPILRKISQYDMSTKSLYKLLKDEFSIYPTFAEEEIEVVHAEESVAKILGIKEGDCVLSIVRITFSQEKIPIEYVYSNYRKDNFKLRVTLKAR